MYFHPHLALRSPQFFANFKLNMHNKKFFRKKYKFWADILAVLCKQKIIHTFTHIGSQAYFFNQMNKPIFTVAHCSVLPG